MAATHHQIAGLLLVTQQFQYLLQGFAGYHEGQGLLVLHGLVTHRQTVAVHADQTQLVGQHLEQGAGIDGAGIVRSRHRKDGLTDHTLNYRLGQRYRRAVLYVGDVGIIRSRHTHNRKLGHVAADDGIVLLIRADGQHLAGHLTHDVAEHTGRQHDLTGLLHRGGDGGGDTQLHIKTRQIQGTALGTEQNTLQCGQTGLGGHGALYVADRFQKFHFTAQNVHTKTTFIHRIIDNINNIFRSRSRGGESVENSVRPRIHGKNRQKIIHTPLGKNRGYVEADFGFSPPCGER